MEFYFHFTRDALKKFFQRKKNNIITVFQTLKNQKRSHYYKINHCVFNAQANWNLSLPQSFITNLLYLRLIIYLLFYLTLQPSAGYDLLVHEVLWLHTSTRHSR
jgi:hypothetical protein